MPDDLTIIVQPALGGSQTSFTGWTSIRVTRGLERCPSDFEISATERDPLNPVVLSIYPGDQCQVMLGSDLILTGYVDRVMPTMGPDSHSITISGRSKCEDIVDCSAEFQTFQVANTNPLALATMLSAPFGITVATIGDIGSTQIPQFNVVLTETPFEIIEQVCRYAALLCFDGRDGNLILARAGTETMASGFAQGQNVQNASSMFTLDQRYSKYTVLIQSTATLFDVPAAGAPAPVAQDTIANAADPGVLRYRPMLLVAEQSDPSYQVAQQRAQWEASRRWGRSQSVRLVCDSWRDQKGDLWEVNALANVNLPALKIVNQNWIISEVSFLKDERGTRAEVTLMPPAAFQVEPIILNPYAADVAAAVNQKTGALGGGPNGDGGVLRPPSAIPTGGAAK